MIQVVNLHKSFAEQKIFDNISFNLNKGEKLALIGRNGQGKSTLFHMVMGDMETDQGEVILPKNYKIGYLHQHIEFTKDDVLSEAMSVLPEDEREQFYRAEKILFGLGLTQEMINASPDSLSGGFQLRIELTKVLLVDPDLLLLDEPTNYLDVVSIRWLENYLIRFTGEMMVISHDRGFLSKVTNSTMGIKRAKVRKVNGSIEQLYTQWDLEEEIHEKTRVNQEKKIKHLTSFIDRFRATASKASLVQSRVKALSKEERVEKIGAFKEMGLYFRYPEIKSRLFLEVKNLSFNYPNGPVLINDLSFHLNRGERLGIVGKNGKGKSTLLKLIADELSQTQGEIKTHQALNIAHFGQTNIERLNDKNNIVEEILTTNKDMSPKEARSIAGALLFEGEVADKKISVLSGGEKSRVLLGKVMANPSHLLLLDEPTNHLDIESVEILAQNIELFEGAVIIVSHDERILDRLTNRLVVFDGEKPFYFEEGYKAFLEKIGWADEVELEDGASEKKMTKKERVQKRQEIIKEKSVELRPLKKSSDALEQEITELEETVGKLEAEMIKISSGAAGDIQSISIELANKQALVDEKFELFSEVSEKLQDKEQHFDQLLQNLEE